MKLKTFKFEQSEILQLKTLSQKLNLTDTDTIRLALRLLEDWTEAKFDYEMIVQLPLTEVTYKNYLKQVFEPFYVVCYGFVVAGGLRDEDDTSLEEYSASRKNHKEMISKMITRENKSSNNTIIKYKIIT